MTSRHAAAIVSFGLGLMVSVGAAAVSGDAPPDSSNRSAESHRVLAQLSSPGAIADASGQEAVLAYLPNIGFVRGTREALATMGRPLEPAPGPNRTVEPCRAAVEEEATKLGARQVEAVSAGREQRDRQGRYVAPVLIRITYNRLDSLEVRLATLTCIVDRSGRVVDAHV